MKAKATTEVTTKILDNLGLAFRVLAIFEDTVVFFVKTFVGFFGCLLAIFLLALGGIAVFIVFLLTVRLAVVFAVFFMPAV